MVASLVDLPAVPGFVVMELIQDARNANEVREALSSSAPLSRVWPSEADSHRCFPISPRCTSPTISDCWMRSIAACAVGRSATLYTFNVKHYSSVPGLKVAQPYVR